METKAMVKDGQIKPQDHHKNQLLKHTKTKEETKTKTKVQLDQELELLLVKMLHKADLKLEAEVGHQTQVTLPETTFLVLLPLNNKNQVLQMFLL